MQADGDMRAALRPLVAMVDGDEVMLNQLQSSDEGDARRDIERRMNVVSWFQSDFDSDALGVQRHGDATTASML